jgi:hypothetical protein
MSASLGLYWLHEAQGLTAVTVVALVDALLVAREWHEIGALRKRALAYLRLPNEDDDKVVPVTDGRRRLQGAS